MIRLSIDGFGVVELTEAQARALGVRLNQALHISTTPEVKSTPVSPWSSGWISPFKPVVLDVPQSPLNVKY